MPTRPSPTCKTFAGQCGRVLGLLVLALSVHAAGPSRPTVPAAPAQKSESISRDARRAYETARGKLLQIRTVLRNADTQASAGSGFYVSDDGLIITNFHVASQLALEPSRYRGVSVSVDGRENEVELLAFDVQHDLALLRTKGAGAPQGALPMRPRDLPLARGERIYSLGNPLDIGFAVTEGTFNGLVQRSFYARIFFGGALNPGMSGGPALDEAGRVVGVNVSKRLDGDLVSFLVPAQMAQDLIARASTSNARALSQPAHDEVARQLLVHQDLLTRRFLEAPQRSQRHGGYVVPLPDDALARCWGRGRDPEFKAFDMERTDCRLDSQVFAGDGDTGFIRWRHEAYDAPKLGALRFSAMYSRSFRNEAFAVRGNRRITPAECSERYVDAGQLAVRAVICASAYRKLKGLYDVSVLLTTVNQSTRGVQGRMDAHGVSFDNGMRLAERYIAGFRWEPTP